VLLKRIIVGYPTSAAMGKTVFNIIAWIDGPSGPFGWPIHQDVFFLDD
jgi:hypothetical protein